MHGNVYLQVDGPSMFPTFTGRGDLVLAEALPGLADRVTLGMQSPQYNNQSTGSGCCCCCRKSLVHSPQPVADLTGLKAPFCEAEACGTPISIP